MKKLFIFVSILSVFANTLAAYPLRPTRSYTQTQPHYQHDIRLFETEIHLVGCDIDGILSQKEIERGMQAFFTFLGVTPHGDLNITHMSGSTAGFALNQFLEEQLYIQGKFINSSNSGLIKLCIAKPYDPEKAAQFLRDFFKADNVYHTSNVTYA